MKALYRQRFLILAVVGVALIVGAILTRPSAEDTTAPPPSELGPTPGPDADGYVRAKRSYVKRLSETVPDAPAAALVSFSDLLRPDEAARLVGDMDVQAVFVSLPAGEPEAVRVETTIPAAVAQRVREVADITRQEIAGLEKADTGDDLVRQRRRALERTTPDCACVYAVAVKRSTIGKLARLQEGAKVHLVDVPQPVTEDLAGWRLSPIVPGEANPGSA